MPRWLERFARVHRPGADGQVRVSGRAIYVLPTKYGVLYLALVLSLLVGAINYANNPAFLLTFLLTGVGLATLVQTWRNLTGLRLRVVGDTPGFPGDTLCFHYRLGCDRAAGHPALQLGLLAEETPPVVLDLAPGDETPVQLCRRGLIRGRFSDGRMEVSTRYPLGLIKAWCYVEADAASVVFPQAAEAAARSRAAADGEGAEGAGEGAEDFVGLRAYQAGDSLRRVDWRAVAAERGMHIKQFGSGGSSRLWLDWDSWPQLPTEARLSRLCRDVLDAHHAGALYGLRVPGVEIAPAAGDAHRRACLTALALHGHPT